MDRLSALDAEFLHLEDGSVHMAIAGACVFDRPGPAASAELEALVASKLHLIPRYRQRVRTVPFELGRPVWVDDPEFDLGYHVRHTALPAPGDDADFCRLMGRLMSQDLDRDRPLWEAWLVEGLAGGRWALVFKVHHCMVDGIAGVGLLTALLDLAPGRPAGRRPSRGSRARSRPGARQGARRLGRPGRRPGRRWPRASRAPSSTRSAPRARPPRRPTGTLRFTERLSPTRPALHRGPDRAPPGRGPTPRPSLAAVQDRPHGLRGHRQRRGPGRRGRRLPGAAASSGATTSTSPRCARWCRCPPATRTARACPTTGCRRSSSTCPSHIADPVERLEAVRAQMAGPEGVAHRRGRPDHGRRPATWCRRCCWAP